ncbi:hypothetical protein [Herbidospora mongoliensis]|nr:hypothetical protein [Herbidospora mongoliensis]
MRTTRLTLRRIEPLEGPRRDEEFDQTGEFRRPSATHRLRGNRRDRD